MEYKIVSYSGAGDSGANPLNPHNGSLEQTLNDYARDGWVLVSYNWGSWRHAILSRPTKEN